MYICSSYNKKILVLNEINNEKFWFMYELLEMNLYFDISYIFPSDEQIDAKHKDHCTCNHPHDIKSLKIL